MQLEELTASSLARLQKLETDRMKAIKSVITTYNATVASLNTPLQLSSERSALLGEAFLPGHDINSIIERYRTGPFRPRPAVWTDFYHEETDVRFGVDLRHWRDTHDTKEQTPDVYAVLLSALDESYKRAASDEGRMMRHFLKKARRPLMLLFPAAHRPQEDLDIRSASALHAPTAKPGQLVR